jgi:hypothetical protein
MDAMLTDCLILELLFGAWCLSIASQGRQGAQIIILLYCDFVAPKLKTSLATRQGCAIRCIIISEINTCGINMRF